MQPIENPFTDADRLLDESSEPLPPVRLVDFHCELTSEKNALGLHLDGRVSAVVGTHTHVVTGDERILPNGTAYQTDLGMTGPVWSVIGFEPRTVLPRFINALPTRFEVGRGGGRLQRRPDRHRPGDRPRARDRADPAARRALTVPARRGRVAGATTRATGRRGQVVPPARRPSTSTPTRPAPTASLEPADLSRRPPPRRRVPGAHRPRHARRLPRGRRGRGGPPAGLDAHPRRRDQRHRRSATSGCGRASSTSSASGWTRTTSAFEAVLAAQRDQRRIRFERTVDAAARPRPGRSTPRSPTLSQRRTTPSAARRVARALMARRPRDERRGRVPAAPRPRQPGLRAARGARTDRGDRGDPRRRRSAVAGPLRRGARRGLEIVRELVDAGLGGLEVYYRVVRRGRPSTRSARSRAELGLVRDRRPDYHGDTGTYAEAHADLWVPPRGRADWRLRARAQRTQAGVRHDRPIRRSTRALPDPRDLAAARPAPTASTRPPDDARLGEYLPEPRALPRFHVWTLGCQMNRSDSEEMAGRLLAAGCAEARRPRRRPTSSSSTPAPSARAPSRRSSAGRASSRSSRRPTRRLRVVLTGCSVREPRPGRPAPPLPGGRPVPAPRRGARARRPARPGRRPRRRSAAAGVDAPTVGRAHGRRRGRRPAGDPRAGPSATAPSPAASAIAAWLPIIYGCDKTCTYCIVPFSRGPERSRPFDDIVDEARSLAAAGLPRGHAARPERQLVRPRPGARRRASATSTRRAGPAAGSTWPGARTSPS